MVRLVEQGSPGIIARFAIEADLVRILPHPTAAIACDCGAVTGEAARPRYGTFPRVLARYVREQQALTWEDAIRKMTAAGPTVGLVDRGVLAAGMAADVAVIDPATVIDHATFDAPMLPSDGIRAVGINERIALGGFTGRARLRPSESERSVTVILDGDEIVVRAGAFTLTTAAHR